MATQSRASSRRRRLAPQDDTESLTSFPDPAPGSPPGSPTTAPAPTMAEHLNGLLDRSEPTMFDERPAVNADDPHALSAANSAVLQGVLDHHGAINLVKRLSESLAERDAHITALQRLCEEYKVPTDRVADAASRVRQAERRRLSLSAASEDLAPSQGTQSESSVRALDHRLMFRTIYLQYVLQTVESAPKSMTVGGTVRGLTRLFGGVPRKRDAGQRSMYGKLHFDISLLDANITVVVRLRPPGRPQCMFTILHQTSYSTNHKSLAHQNPPKERNPSTRVR